MIKAGNYTHQITTHKRDTILNQMQQLQKKLISKNLKKLGAVRYNLWLPETHILPSILFSNEDLDGVVYGRYVLSELGQDKSKPVVGRGLMAITNSRLLFIDKKPTYLRCDEFPLSAITGVTYSKVWVASTVVLHTRAGDYKIRTFNNNCAKKFVSAVKQVTQSQTIEEIL